MMSNHLKEPPEGCLISRGETDISYFEIGRRTEYHPTKGRKQIWTGVNCNGEYGNNKTIFMNGKEVSICSVCQNELSCMFKMDNKQIGYFILKEEHYNIYRESFVTWIDKNKNKYNINVKKAW